MFCGERSDGTVVGAVLSLRRFWLVLAPDVMIVRGFVDYVVNI